MDQATKRRKGLLNLVSFEFEDGMCPSKRNAQVVRYTNYIIDVTQDILVASKSVRNVP